MSPLIFLYLWSYCLARLFSFEAVFLLEVMKPPYEPVKTHRLSVIWKNWMFNQECEHVFQVENSKIMKIVFYKEKFPPDSLEEGFGKLIVKENARLLLG